VIDLPEAFHTGTDDVPFADDWAGAPGIRLKLLMADIEGARFAVWIRFTPGILLPPHKAHRRSARVHALRRVVLSRARRHSSEPAGSYLFGRQGEVLAVGDAESHLRNWPAALRAQGKPVPKTLPIGGTMRYRALAV
jgi:2,4'-dihydroxyacetophenone dioxygenase